MGILSIKNIASGLYRSLVILVTKGVFVSKQLVNIIVKPHRLHASPNFLKIAFILAVSFFSLSGYAAVRYTFSSDNPAVPAANLPLGSTKQPIYRAVIQAYNGGGQSLTKLTFTATGTFVTSDINTTWGNYGYIVWFSTTDNLSGATKISNPIAPSASGTQVTVPLYSQYLSSSNTYYVWITADISATAVNGHTLTVGALSTSDFTFDGGSKNGNMNDGGTQTFGVPLKQFRSVANGNWNALGTWQQSVDGGSSWSAATTTPLATDGLVDVMPVNTVTLTANAAASSLTIDGTLDVSTYTLTGSAALNVSSTGSLLVGGTTNFPTGFSTKTFTGGSTVSYYLAGNQTVSGQAYSNLTLSGSGVKTTTGVTVNGTLSMAGNSSMTVSALPTYGSSAALQYNGTAAQTTGTEFPASFTGSGGLIINNNNTGGVTLNANKSISFLTLTNGILTTGTTSGVTNVLSVTNSTTLAINGGSATSFVYGPLKWTLPTITAGTVSTYNFPVGSSATNYLPFSLVNPVTTGATTAQVQAFTANAGGSFDAATLTAMSPDEYWSLATSANFTTSSVSISRLNSISPTYDAIGGSSASNGTYTSLAGLSGTYGVTNSNPIGTTNKFFRFVKGKSLIFVSTHTMNSFSYPVGLGPSIDLPLTVSGTSLTTNIQISPSPNFEISTTTGAAFAPQSLITLFVTNGTVVPTNIYVRMIAGHALGAVGPENIVCSSDPAVSQSVTCSGTVVAAAVITPSTPSLGVFHYNVGSVTSPALSFTVSGTNTTTPIAISAPAHYEICLTSGGTYSSSLSLPSVSGSVASTTIYVRLILGLTANIYNESISLTTSNGVPQTVACTGTVSAPTVTVSTFNLGGFIYSYNGSSGVPSGEQTFTVSGSSLTANLILTAPTSFEICLNSGGAYSSSITLTKDASGNVASTTIFVRMKGALAVNNPYGPGNLTAASTGAITQNVALSGQVAAANTPTIITAPTTLNGFVYVVGNGPSVEQTFTVSATALSGNLVITPPTNNILISLTPNNEGSTAIPITPVGGKVNAVTIYVRLAGGLPAASYASQNIVLTSALANPVNVVCKGEVILLTPTITATANDVNPLAACDGITVNLKSSGFNIGNQYWTGPNNFYTTDANPSLGPITATNAGTYTVTGSALSGVNLLTNGDFEQGNIGFGSSYNFVANSNNQDIYYVGPNPQNMNSAFCTCPDHTTGHGNQMYCDGAITDGVIAWSESVSVSKGADYQFSFWTQNIDPGGVSSKLQLYVNGIPVGTEYTTPASGAGWQQFFYNVNSGTSTVLQLTIINKSIVALGNDFALDDISFQQAFPVTSSVKITDNISVPVSVSIIASSNPVYSGGPVTFTAIPVNGGTPPLSFQWYVNTNTMGTNNISFTYTPTAGDVIKCVLTSSLPCTNPATSNQLIAYSRTNFWVGKYSSNWGDPANWSGGYIPAPGNDVEYATNANNSPNPANRDLQLDVNRTIGNLVNASSQGLIIPTGLGLTVNYAISTNGNANRITIKSDPSVVNGSLIFNNPVGLPVNATVEMYSPAWKEYPGQSYEYLWQFFGIPLTSVEASPTFDGSWVRLYNESSSAKYNKWTQLGNNDVLTPFKGYEITQDVPKKIIFQGTLLNQDATITLTNSAGAWDSGQNIVSNPYTAAINVKYLTFGGNTDEVVYLYNTGSFSDWTTHSGGTTYNENTNITQGQYQAVPKAHAGEGSIPRDIPSMSGFLVKVNSGTTDILSISYNSLINNESIQRVKQSTSATSDVTYMGIAVKGSKFGDKMWLFDEPGTSRNFDNGWDGYKMMGIAVAPQLFAMEESGNYQVSTSADMNNTYLGFQAGVDMQDTLLITHQNLDKQYAGVYLYDLVENKTIDITTSGTSYAFVTESTPLPIKRFKIVTQPFDENIPDKNSQLKVFSSGNTVFVQNLSALNGEMTLYDLIGHCLKKAPFGPNSVTAIEAGGVTGPYVVSAATSSERVGKRLILKD